MFIENPLHKDTRNSNVLNLEKTSNLSIEQVVEFKSKNKLVDDLKPLKNMEVMTWRIIIIHFEN